MGESVPRASVQAAQIRKDYTEGIKAQAGKFHSRFLQVKFTCLGFFGISGSMSQGVHKGNQRLRYCDAEV
jgi:hypothetical protein